MALRRISHSSHATKKAKKYSHFSSANPCIQHHGSSYRIGVSLTRLSSSARPLCEVSRIALFYGEYFTNKYDLNAAGASPNAKISVAPISDTFDDCFREKWSTPVTDSNWPFAGAQ